MRQAPCSTSNNSKARTGACKSCSCGLVRRGRGRQAGRERERTFLPHCSLKKRGASVRGLFSCFEALFSFVGEAGGAERKTERKKSNKHTSTQASNQAPLCLSFPRVYNEVLGGFSPLQVKDLSGPNTQSETASLSEASVSKATVWNCERMKVFRSWSHTPNECRRICVSII